MYKQLRITQVQRARRSGFECKESTKNQALRNLID